MSNLSDLIPKTKVPFYQAVTTWQVLIKTRDLLRSEGKKYLAQEFNEVINQIEFQMLQYPEAFSNEPDPELEKQTLKQKKFKKGMTKYLKEKKLKLEEYAK